MGKFKVGDRVRKIDDEFLGAFSIGDELFVTGTSCIGNYWVGKNLGEETDTAYESDLELITSAPKEITLNGATYVLKEDQKPEHEWKFGDWARNPKYGVVFVGNVNGPDEIWCVIGDSSGWRYGQHVSPAELTYISSATIPE